MSSHANTAEAGSSSSYLSEPPPSIPMTELTRLGPSSDTKTNSTIADITRAKDTSSNVLYYSVRPCLTDYYLCREKFSDFSDVTGRIHRPQQFAKRAALQVQTLVSDSMRQGHGASFGFKPSASDVGTRVDKALQRPPYSTGELSGWKVLRVDTSTVTDFKDIKARVTSIDPDVRALLIIPIPQCPAILDGGTCRTTVHDWSKCKSYISFDIFPSEMATCTNQVTALHRALSSTFVCATEQASVPSKVDRWLSSTRNHSKQEARNYFKTLQKEIRQFAQHYSADVGVYFAHPNTVEQLSCLGDILHQQTAEEDCPPSEEISAIRRGKRPERTISSFMKVELANSAASTGTCTQYRSIAAPFTDRLPENIVLDARWRSKRPA